MPEFAASFRVGRLVEHGGGQVNARLDAHRAAMTAKQCALAVFLLAQATQRERDGRGLVAAGEAGAAASISSTTSGRLMVTTVAMGHSVMVDIMIEV
jgi:hypothetical protein